jgi:ATP-dependent Clp protease protease subunit
MSKSSLTTLTKLEIGLFAFIGVFAGFTAFTLLNNKVGKHTEKNAQTSQVQILSPSIKSQESSTAITGEREVQAGKEVKVMELPGARTLNLAGVVNSNAIILSYKIAELSKQSKDPIYLVIDSPGGSVLAGGILLSAMQASRAPIYTICHSLCASMAAMIHQYGAKRLTVDRSILMFHPASGGAEGDIDRIQSMISMIQKYVGKMEADVAARLGLKPEAYKALSVNELWLDSDDQLKMNAADELVSISLKQDLFEDDNGDMSNRVAQQSNAKNYLSKELLLGRDVIWIMPGIKYEVK